MEYPRILDGRILIQRLLDEEREVVFLLGSALTMPSSPDARDGVPGVQGIIHRLRDSLGSSSDAMAEFDREIETSQNKYQAAFQYVREHKGFENVQTTIRRAVLEAYKEKDKVRGDVIRGSRKSCERLERQIEKWHLRPGALAFGEIFTRFRNPFSKTVLTTNFDPLIEISIQKAGGTPVPTVLHKDGTLTQTAVPFQHVVHLHGYWYGADSLHTANQLAEERPRLENSIARLISGCVLVAIGYGGWDDVFMRAVRKVLADDEGNPELIWCFHASDPGEIQEDFDHLLEQLKKGGERVTLFGGIDIHDFFVDLLRSFEEHHMEPEPDHLDPKTLREALRAERERGRKMEKRLSGLERQLGAVEMERDDTKSRLQGAQKHLENQTRLQESLSAVSSDLIHLRSIPNIEQETQGLRALSDSNAAEFRQLKESVERALSKIEALRGRTAWTLTLLVALGILGLLLLLSELEVI